MTKTCSKCGETKPLEYFSRKKTGKFGRDSRCKVCVNALTAVWQRANAESKNSYNRAWRASNPDKSAQHTRNYRERNPQKTSEFVRASTSRRRARRNAVETLVILPKEMRRLTESSCAFCGETQNTHVDHIIPIAKGGRHSVGNLQTLCSFCNVSKKDKLYADWRYRHAN